ncbi:hypothetical protein [Persephonella sp.]|uniref:hypothetical protein n=1 Tax=Persephonella sp. TaxID=2060922 RepID=UPI0025D44BCA|nr:hypothetical protein [Persephonella sp.]
MEENLYVKFLEEIKFIPEIEKLNFIDPPDGAEVDVSLKLKFKSNANKWKVMEKIQSRRWKYSKLDNPITLYIEFEK